MAALNGHTSVRTKTSVNLSEPLEFFLVYFFRNETNVLLFQAAVTNP